MDDFYLKNAKREGIFEKLLEEFNGEIELGIGEQCLSDSDSSAYDINERILQQSHTSSHKAINSQKSNTPIMFEHDGF